MQKEKQCAGKITGREYAYWLCLVPGIGNRAIARFLAACGTPEEVYRGGESLWRQFLTQRQLAAMRQAYQEVEPFGAYEEMRRRGIRFVLQDDPEYPERLRQIPDAPYALFVKGKTPAEDVMAVAVVGARECSEYGRFVADGLGKELGRRGIQVISGMARGIDGVSQRAALDAGGVSFGVLGSGVDVCYPKENQMLYDRLCAQGGLLSVYPPGTEPKSQNFPPRNRIVSGLADVLAVIEARVKSGTLITVDMALEQGKEVYVVPGRVTDRLSDGCNRLLKQGAGVFLSPEDFLEEVTAAWERKRGPGAAPAADCAGRGENVGMRLDPPMGEPRLPPQLQRIYEALELQPKSLTEIREGLSEGCSVQQLTVFLMQLCMEGLAVQLTAGYFARCGRACGEGKIGKLHIEKNAQI